MNLKTILGGCIGITSIMLIGCDGGSVPSPSDPPSSNPLPSSGVNNVTLGGTATKGIINGGNVVAEELDVSGTVITAVGSTTTAADGSYTLDISNDYNGGPIKVTISADENTWMKCDVPAGCGMRTDDIADSDTVIDFSEWYKPGSLTMMALVAGAVANDTINVNITPYTDLAARHAMAAGSLTPGEVDSANSRVSNLLGGGGINILSTQPLDITDAAAVNDGDADATEIAYAALSAAIAALADTSGGNPDINAALETLWNSFSDGSIIPDDSGTATDDSTISLQEIVDGATSAFAEMGITDVSNTLDSLQAVIDADTDGVIVPEPGPDTGDTALEKVKAFVGDVRTWATVIEEETRVKGEAFGTQVNLAAKAADSSISLMAGPAIRSTVIAIFKRLTETDAVELDSDAYKTGMPGDPQFESGTITYAGGVVTITNAVIDGVIVNTSVQLPEDKTSVSSMTIAINYSTLTSVATDLTISSGTIVASLATPYFLDYVAINTGTAARPDISGGSVNLNVSLTQRQDDFGATLASPVTFTGTLLTTLANPVTDDITGEITWFTPATLTLTGNISDTAGSSLDASLTANISNASSFQPVRKPDFDSGVVPEDTDNWLAGTIGLNFMLQLEGLPKASVNIDGNRTAFETGTATITIVYGVRQISIVSAFSDTSSAGSVTIINQDGVSMSVAGADFNAFTGDIEYNGQTYGSIARLDNGLTKVTYTDGSFETF